MCRIFKIANFIPLECHKTVYDIDYSKLYEKGRKIILLDLDNTLIPYDQSEPNEKLISFFKDIHEIGFKIMIISNNRKRRVKAFADIVKCDYVYTAMKPLKRGYKKAIKMLKTPEKHEILAIGDQIMTDVLGSSGVGIDCILVKPIKKKTEKWYTKVNRMLENRVLRKMKKHNFEMYEKIIALEDN